MSEFTLKDAFVSLTLPPLGDTTVSIRFTPQYLGTVSSAWHASSDDKDAGGLALGRRNAKLTGAAAMPGQEFFRDTTITVSCPTASDALILISDTLFATGTSATVINHLGHTAKPDPNGWSNFTAYYDNRIVNPDTIVVTLENKGALVVTENFRPPLNVNGSYSDTIIATTPNGDTLRVRATVNVVSRGGSVSDTAIDFGTVPFKSAPVSKTFTITDTMSTPLLVRPMTQTGRYKSAYTYTSNPAVPVTLQPGKSVTFTVTFDPSVSFDSMQTAFIQPDMNSCQLPYAIPVQAQVSVRDAETQGYKSSKILACNTQSGPVTVFNNIKNQGALTIDDTVISVTLTGTNASSWTLDTVKGVVGTIIRGGGGSLVIPTTYHPSGSQIQNATAYVVVRVRNSRRDKASSGDTTMTQIITGSAEGLNVLASSKVAIAEPADEKGDQNLQIPIDITVSGFADSLKTVNITTVRLTYLFNVDLLDMKNGLGSAFQGLSGWTLDPNNSKVIMDSRRPGTTNMRFVDTVILTLTNATPLDNATPSLGTINFRMTLPSQDSTSDISIHSIELLQSSGAAVTGCVGTDTLGGTLAIVHHCGNEILTAFMNGNTALLGITTPATPDPVHGGTIAISYVNRGESNLTLTMYDMLGNEVARPLDAVHHAAGSWQVNCNVSKLSSGTYTYRLTDGHAMISKQFVIQR
jgi:hypothetical protein